jgi:hypothetical protein
MEEIPAGKCSNEVPSPKKVSNPIGSQSQWSFGWQGNDKPVFNRPNDSKGKALPMKVLTTTTTRAASCSGRTRGTIGGGRRRRCARRRWTTLSRCGTITRRLLARPRWCWATKSQTTGRRTRLTRSGRRPLSPTVARSDVDSPYPSQYIIIPQANHPSSLSIA